MEPQEYFTSEQVDQMMHDTVASFETLKDTRAFVRHTQEAEVQVWRERDISQEMFFEKVARRQQNLEVLERGAQELYGEDLASASAAKKDGGSSGFYDAVRMRVQAKIGALKAIRSDLLTEEASSGSTALPPTTSGELVWEECLDYLQ